MRYAWAGLIAAGACCLPATAMAQTDQSVPPGVGAADRLRPAFDPVGARIGGVFVFPQLDVTSSVTDNVLATKEDRKSDLILVTRPSVTVRSDWSRHRLVAEAFVSQSLHARLGNEDATQYGASVDGTYDLSRRTAVRVVGEAQHLVLDRTAYNNVVTAREPIEYERYTGSIGVDQEFNRLAISAGIGASRADFSDATSYAGLPIDQDFRDFTQTLFTGGARYRFGAGPSLIARVQFDRNEYDESPPGLNRDSKGMKVEGGVAFDLSSLLYGEVRVGYINRKYANPLFENASGVSFGANMLWNVTPLTSLRFRADRSFQESRSGVAAANLVTQGEAGVDHELLRYVILTASMRYAVIDPLGDLSSSREYGAALRARYLVDRRVQLNASYQFNKRAGTTLNQPFAVSVLSLGIRYTL